MWVKVGLASSNFKSVSISFPCFSSVQTPFGPLKSGIPTRAWNNNYCSWNDSWLYQTQSTANVHTNIEEYMLIDKIHVSI